RGRGLREHAEAELRAPEVQPIPIAEPRPSLPLAVDQDLRGAIDLLELEVASVEDDLRVVRQHARIREMDVVAERPPDRGDRLVQADEDRRSLGWEIANRSHPAEKATRNETLRNG